jgi:hypothetical protein
MSYELFELFAFFSANRYELFIMSYLSDERSTMNFSYYPKIMGIQNLQFFKKIA